MFVLLLYEFKKGTLTVINMKKKMYLIIILVILLVSLVSCKFLKADYPIYNGEFEYSSETIIALTEEAKIKDIIVFPSEIDGVVVQQIGLNTSYGKSRTDFDNAAFTKVYLNSNIKMITKDFLDQPKSFELYISSYVDNEYDISYIIYRMGHSMDFSFDNTKIYCPYYLYDAICYLMRHMCEEKDICIANVLYCLNDGTDKVFFVDDCDNTKVNVTPPNPTRKGYKFIGWYKETECINEWDFKNDIIPAKQYDTNGDYLLKETKIYAGWELISNEE